MGIAGSEVRVGEKLEDFEANPMVVLEGAGAASGAPATESSGRRRRQASGIDGRRRRVHVADHLSGSCGL